MAIRIALQCSEADAHLILSEENTAARLLTRPGEAIYNDANGLPEGNNLFQVVWLSDKRRQEYLQDILDLAKAQHRPPASPIVFEGNLPADTRKNALLNKLLEATEWPEQGPRYEQAWLGDAIAIKDPTVAVFRPQSGSNLLIIGQNDEAALSMFMMAAVSIAAQHPPRKHNGLKLYLLDGTPVDSWLNGKLGQVADWLPHNVKKVSQRDLASLDQRGRRRTRPSPRQQRGDRGAGADLPDDLRPPAVPRPPQGGRRLRLLRPASARRRPPRPAPSSARSSAKARRSASTLIVWCDSVNNMNRTFDRNALREFELRVLFQMSANDSSTVIDSPVAGKLGENRALFYSEEENRIEKFRPYGLPDEEWVAEVKQKLASRPAPVEPEPIPEPEPAPAPNRPRRPNQSPPAVSQDNGNGHGKPFDADGPTFPEDDDIPVFPSFDEPSEPAEAEAETNPDNI